MTEITTNQTSTFYIDQPLQSWALAEGVSITVANGHGIVNNDAFNDTVLSVNGDIVANGLYKSGIFSNGEGAALYVGTNGSIHAYNGIAARGESSFVKNYGAITATGIGIYGNAKNVDIQNDGSIDAKFGIYLENSSYTKSVVDNRGTIHADYGIVTDKGTAFVTLDVDSVIDAKFVGVDLSASAQGVNHVTNYGLIDAEGVAILGGASSDQVWNLGTIKGSVILGDGADVFNGGDGTMDHAVDGGLGDDTYQFGATDYAIVDAGGSDTIISETTRTLVGYSNIENLRLTGVANVNATGNTLQNFIEGNDGNNVLFGGNDAVVDTLHGGKGDDTFILGTSSDVVYDGTGADGTTNAGLDTITSTISRSLANYDRIENLTLQGTNNVDGTGDAGVNLIIGNAANNVLDGGIEANDILDMPKKNPADASEIGSGPGVDVVDVLNGGAGNDTYVLRGGNDNIIDASGIDTITSTVSRNLADMPTIENLTLVGSDPINGTGNALANIITGNDANNFLDGGADTLVDTLIGGMGNDTYVLGTGTDMVVDNDGLDMILSTGSRDLGNYASIENLTLQGSANVNGAGNAQVNFIQGNAGNNVLFGGNDTLVDTLKGDAGNDTYVLGAGKDVVSDGAGIDTITTTIYRDLSNYSQIENLTMEGTADIDADGNKLDNVITGNAGANGMAGGLGNDTYFVGAGDSVLEAIGEGNDTVVSTASFMLGLGDSVETLSLAASTGAANLNLTGNELANTLIGNAGNNLMNGGDDALIDTLNGGAGNDVYVLGSGTDTIVDTSGIDAIFSTVTRSLVGYATIENLTLKGSASVNATGNALVNAIVGNAGNNILDGGTDSVTDTLVGGLGNDTYMLGAGSDIVSDSGGIDIIMSSVGRSLAGYAQVENVRLLGTSNINATGNALDNTLVGNSGTNVLTGGAGNDTYGVHNATDIVVEVAGQGADTVVASASYALSSGQSIETLQLSSGTGASNFNLTGNEIGNTLRGNAGDNVLKGGGGLDFLLGGAGHDTFLFGALSESGFTAATADHIMDFTAGDKIHLAGIDANGLVGGDQGFLLDANGSFSVGEIRQTLSGSNLVLDFNTDGDAGAEMSLLLVNHGLMGSGDFIL